MNEIDAMRILRKLDLTHSRAVELLHVLKRKSIEQRLDRNFAQASQLHRALRRRAEAQTDPSAPHLKCKLPTVCKSLTPPGAGTKLLKGSARALRYGNRGDCRKFVESWYEEHGASVST